MQLQCSDISISHKDFTVLKLMHALGRLLGLPYPAILRETLKETLKKRTKNFLNHRCSGILFQRTVITRDSHHKNLERTTSAEDILIVYLPK